MKIMLKKHTVDSKKLIRLAMLLFILCFFVLKNNAQSTVDFRFVQPGLPDRARCFLRDSRNYLWFGTDDGLYRYDGVNLNRYRTDTENSKSISGNKIIGIEEDAGSNIWIAPDNEALCLYSRDDDSFIRFKNNPADSTSISGNACSALFTDKQHNLWVGVEGKYGLNKWNPLSKTFTHYRVIDTEKNIEVNTIYSIDRDKSGNIWIADDKLDGLFCLEPKTKKVSYYPSASFPITTGGKLLFIDNDGIIWISTYGLGLFSFNPQNKTYTKYSSAGDGTGTNGTIVSDIIQEDDQHLLISVDHGGINRYNKKTGLFEYIINAPQIPSGLSNDGIWSLYKDREGILWVGTSGGGVNVCNPKAHQFKQLKSMPGVSNSLSNNGVNSLYEDSKGQIWMTTEGGGINVYDLGTGNFKHYLKDPKNPYSLPCNVVRQTIEDRNHDYWFGTWNGGIIKLDHYTGRFTQYLPQSKEPFNITGRNIWTMLADNDGLVWISVFSEGIDLLDPDKGIVKKFLSDTETEGWLYDPVVHYFYQDSHSRIWVCNNMKLSVFDPVGNSFKIVPVVPEGEHTISFLEDKEGYYWLGTARSGLIRFKEDGSILQTINTSNGLADNAINSILEDDYHNLWVATSHGLSRVNYKTGSIRNYSEKDGLPKETFWQNDCLETRSGEMYFGGSDGVVCFNPDNLQRNNDYIPPVYIDEFLIFNKPVSAGQPNSPLQKVIEQTTKIVLNWDQSVFTFGFTAINYTFPENAQYAYKMEGFDKEWNYTDASRRTATYTNLDPGKYTFRVKASNNDGVWNETGTSVEVIILPPWWRTWWFRIIVVLFILGGTLGYYFYRITALKKQKKHLEDVVKERTQEIEGKNSQLVLQANELRESNNNLQKSYSLLNATLESTADGILVVDKNGKITNFNRKFIELWGIPESIISLRDDEKVIDFVLNQLVQPESFLTKVRELYANDLATSFDVLEFKDGRIFERYSQSQLFEGKNVGRVWSFRDITAEKQAVDALEWERYLLRTIMDNIPDTVYFKDTESRFFRINKAHAKLFGLDDPADAKGKTDHDFFSSVHAQEAFNDEQEIIKSGIPIIGKVEMETWLDRPSRWISTTKMPFVDAKGNIIGIFGVSRDITTHKLAEKSLKDSEAALKELNAAKDKFFSIIAHDLRSPFSGFMGLTEIMAEDLSGFTKDQIREFVINMRNSAKGIYGLLENLLQWARLQRDSVAFNVQLLQLHQIVAECVAVSAEVARKKDIELVFNVPDDLTVLADSNILQTIIRNLVSNALKFTLRNGRVTITAKAIDEQDVEVAVKDTGIGMDVEMVSNLFRLDVKTNREGTEGELSSGLGLILCKEFVEKFGGKIWVESEEMKGTTFFFSLHRQSNTAHTADSTTGQLVSEKQPTAIDGMDLSGKRILVAEDNKVSMKVAVMTLKKLTQYVYSAANGLEAVDVFSWEKPDIILMDIHMPEMDGIEATQRIREIEKRGKTETRVTIISMSATTSDEDIQKCIDAGMDASLGKPFKTGELVGVLKGLWDRFV